MSSQTKRLFIKCNDMIPSGWEVRDFENEKGVKVNEVPRLYVKYKDGKRRKLKRLHIKVDSYECELCGFHTYAKGRVGGKDFNTEIF